MLGKLFGWLAPYKSQLFAMAGVVAVAGIGTTFIAWNHIQAQEETIDAQGDRIGDLVAINRAWAKQDATRARLRDLEQKNSLLLQERLVALDERAAAQSKQLRELEKNNAEVKALLAQRLPADLKRLLEK